MENTSIRLSNHYYTMHLSETTVDNLAWSGDRILNTCKDALRDKIIEKLVVVFPFEAGGPLVLKSIPDIVMDIGGSHLR